jgi:2-polyprenyl-6-methoxyphenol hydroxylase-like FAD-dependent oxidoreductase
VGADGLNSVVRSQLLGPDAPAYSGYMAWTAVVELDDDRAVRNALNLSFGPGTRFVYCQVGASRYAWVASANAPEDATDPPGARKQATTEAFADYPPPIPQLIDAADEAAIARMNIYDRKPSGTWGSGRVTLLGDAAHPMTPNVAQGACQAIEDAVFLAKSVRDGPIEAGLRSYEAVRRKRTAPIQRRAHAIGEVMKWSNPVVCAVRDQVFRVFAPLAERTERKTLSYEV